MPATNPFVPLIEVGGSASAGPAAAGANFSVGNMGDNHVSAGMVLLGVGLLVLLWKNKFRFSTTVG